MGWAKVAVSITVPAAVVDRLRAARRVLAVSHENPDADTLGATLGVVRIVEALGGTADAVCTDPVPALYDFISGIERFRTDPDTTALFWLELFDHGRRASIDSFRCDKIEDAAPILEYMMFQAAGLNGLDARDDNNGRGDEGS